MSSLDGIKAACKRLGWKFVEGQRKFKWYGTWVDDSPIPEGMFSESETIRLRHASKAERTAAMTAAMSRCDHAIIVPGASYEVGVVRKGNGWGLAWDWYAPGGLLPKMGGKNGGLFLQAYALEQARRAAIKQGFKVLKDVVRPDGQAELEVIQ